MASEKPSRKSDLRLQKYLAECGAGSRRFCERLISEGRVQLDGETVTEQGVRIDPATANVKVDGKEVFPQSLLYFLLNKPKDVLCTSSDPEGRKTFLRLFPEVRERIYTVGRLDRDSEGLIIVTNDGEFANRVSHPRYELEKEYSAWVERPLTPAELSCFTQGVLSKGELLKAVRIVAVSSDAAGVKYRIILKEGRNRHIRRMFDHFGVGVRRLRRVRIGSIELGHLRTGQSRPLRKREINELIGNRAQ
ncbi:MAG: rRNA pseudouridine synthase [Verrucomicrobia bacterium]|nr:rRNA pseudouridine synthase [Verrucomicrobiota bacterium]